MLGCVLAFHHLNMTSHRHPSSHWLSRQKLQIWASVLHKQTAVNSSNLVSFMSFMSGFLSRVIFRALCDCGHDWCHHVSAGSWAPIITRRTSRWSPWKAWHLWYGLPAEQRDLGRRGLSLTNLVLKRCSVAWERQQNELHHLTISIEDGERPPKTIERQLKLARWTAGGRVSC